MRSHELARILLANPDLPIATHALGHTYASEAYRDIDHLKVGILEHYAGRHIVIGDISKKNLNKPNWYVSNMVYGEAPEEGEI